MSLNLSNPKARRAYMRRWHEENPHANRIYVRRWKAKKAREMAGLEKRATGADWQAPKTPLMERLLGGATPNRLPRTTNPDV